MEYRALNKLTEKTSYPILRIVELLNSLESTNVITSLDLSSAFHQVPIKKEDRHKTAFTYRNSKYEFRRIPFGLTSAPGFFSRVNNETLYDLIGHIILVYLDDIVITSTDKVSHLEKIEWVLEKLSIADLKLKVTKCKFFYDRGKILGL